MGRKYMVRYRGPVMKPVRYEKLYEKAGTNVGNLVYSAGAIRVLMKDQDTEFISPPKNYTCGTEEIDKLNQTCDDFIINLADALRRSNVQKLKNMTALIRKLSIPCVVVGCGIRAPYEPGELSFDFDDIARDFFGAVLEKSEIIGLRGRITGEYLKRLGFREEQDYTVIGCPSMYMYGENLTCRDTIGRLSEKDAKISVNLSPNMTLQALEFIMRIAKAYPGAAYLPQNSADCILLYYGIPRDKKTNMPSGWPVSLEHSLYKEHDAFIFNHPEAWIEFQRGRDLSVGTRMHGNITSVLAGTPALFLPQDARTRELCDFHAFACLTPSELEKEPSLEEAVKQVDFQSPLKRHGENFRHYLDFMKKNGLPTIFDDPEGTAPYDQLMGGFRSLPPMERFDRVSPEEAGDRRKKWKELNKPAVGLFQRKKH